MGSLYRSQHELVFVFKTGSGPHRNNVQLGRFGRNRSNVWRYPGVNSFARSMQMKWIEPSTLKVARFWVARLRKAAKVALSISPEAIGKGR